MQLFPALIKELLGLLIDLQKTLLQKLLPKNHLQKLLIHHPQDDLDKGIIVRDLTTDLKNYHYLDINPAHSKKDILFTASISITAVRPIIANRPLILSA